MPNEPLDDNLLEAMASLASPVDDLIDAMNSLGGKNGGQIRDVADFAQDLGLDVALPQLSAEVATLAGGRHDRSTSGSRPSRFHPART